MKNDPEEYLPPIPRAVTILFFFVLSMTAWVGIRAWAALVNWDTLATFRANPIYIFATGLIWFILGAVLTALIFKGSRHALVVGPVFAILYVLWFWLDRLFVQVTPAPNGIFNVIVTAVMLIIFHLFLFWPSSQAFFKETQ